MAELSAHDKAVLNCVFNPNLPLEEAIIQEPIELIDIEDDTEEVKRTKMLEIEAVKLAESGDLVKALEILNSAIDLAPKRASLYNNRAHVYQFMKKSDEALADLSQAIELSGENMKKTLSQAYCQRGILYRKAGNNDLAREDFENAARLGNHFAKGQLVELNPYAALCNQMLRKVMDSL